MTDGPVGELMLLRCTGTVEDYPDKFLALACRDADLSEAQLIQMFTAGLVNPLKTNVALRRPQSLDDTIMFARAYEQRLHIAPADQYQGCGARSIQQSAASSHALKTAQAHTPPASASSAAPGSGKTTTLSSTLPRRRLSPREMAQRRTEGLGYNCDEKFVLGHRCKKLFIIEVVGFEDVDEEVDEEIECSALSGALDAPGISLHAITGARAKGYQTMKVYVSVGDAVAVALLDSGSSHNFIDVDMARRAGVVIRPEAGLSVAVANGDRIMSPGKIRAQAIYIGGEVFHIDIHALPLGEYDMVLGMQWLGTLGPLLWDFGRHTIAFLRDGRRVLWHGVDVTPGMSTAALSSSGGALLDELLEEFGSLFAEPQGLPPRRHLSHRIRLKPGAEAVAVRPYRYAHTQKDELERQCDEMLRQGVIRPSSSAFSSPALLIRKADGTWRFCVDYCTLNDATI
jgi:hypothetical protein